MSDICESPRIRSQLDELGNAELNTRLVVRQGLPQMSQKPLTVEHFDDSHPLQDDDCIIPEDQEAQLEAQDGWGVPVQKQKSDSQLIAENGSEPESQGMGVELSLTTVAPVRVGATEQSQDVGDDNESVPDSQGFHFQNENIEETFVQCSDTESDEESNISARNRVSQGNAAAKKTPSSQVTVSIETTTTTITTADEVAVSAVVTLSASPASAQKKKRFKVKKKKKVQLSQQSTQSDVEPTPDADELASDAERERLSVTDPIGGPGIPQTQAPESESQEGFAEPEDTTTDANESQTQMLEGNTTQVDDAKRQVVKSVVVETGEEVAAMEETIFDRGVDRLTQQVDPFAESQDASGSIFVHFADSQDGPLTQAPGDHLIHMETQDDPITTEAEVDDESSQTERGGSFGAMDEDVWHTQPNEDSQVFGFASQSQSEREPGSGLQSIQSFIGVEPPQPLARIAESTEEPEFGTGDSFAGDEEHHRLPDNQSQLDHDDHQQSENLLSPKLARKQAEDLAKNLRQSPVTIVFGGSPARPDPPSQPDVMDLTSPAHSKRATPSGQKRPLGSVRPDHLSGSKSSTAEASASSRHRKAPRRPESSSSRQPSNGNSSLLTASSNGSEHDAHFRGVPLSIQQRALRLCDDPSVTSNGGTSSNASNGEYAGSLFTLLSRLQHRESTQQQSTISLASRRRVNTASSSGAVAAEIRPSKRYEHLFPPLRMDDLDTMILERFGKSKEDTLDRSRNDAHVS